MAELNDAWRILSDPDARLAYDRSLARVPTPERPSAAAASASVPFVPQPAPAAQRSRREAWVLGVQAQILRLSRLAGRSATQTLLVRSNRAPRATYEALVELIVASLTEDTEARVRAARAAGTAPLDLGVAATLVGLRTLADRIRRQSSLGITAELEMTAELVDRMWDVLAHELSKPLTDALGGNPHIANVLRTKGRVG